MLTGAAAGLVFGIQDALTRQTLQALHSAGFGGMLSTWAPYALVGAGATGIWLMQSAFSAGPLNVSLPAISAGEPVVGILLGVVVFGDRIQDTPGELAIYAGGLAALVIGVIMVGRSPALSQLRAWTEESISSLPSLPHVPVPHVPTLPLSLPGRRGDHEGDATPESSDDAARDDSQFQEQPPAANLTVIPPETDDAPQAIAPEMRRSRFWPRRPAGARSNPLSVSCGLAKIEHMYGVSVAITTETPYMFAKRSCLGPKLHAWLPELSVFARVLPVQLWP